MKNSVKPTEANAAFNDDFVVIKFSVSQWFSGYPVICCTTNGKNLTKVYFKAVRAIFAEKFDSDIFDELNGNLVNSFSGTHAWRPKYTKVSEDVLKNLIPEIVQTAEKFWTEELN